MPPTNRTFTTPYQPLNIRFPFTGASSFMDGGTPAPSTGCAATDSQEQGWIVDSTGSAGNPSVLITPCFTLLPGVRYTALIDIRVTALSGPVLSLDLETCAGVAINSFNLSTAGGRSIQQVLNIISESAANVRLGLSTSSPDAELSVFSLVLNRQ